MPSVPPPIEQVQEMYDQWVEAGRPKIGVFARQIGREDTTVRRWLNRFAVQLGVKPEEKLAARQGFAPDADMTHPVPSPFVVKGTSTLYDENGKAKLQWVKTKLDDQLVQEAIREFIEHMVSGANGLSPKIPTPTHNNKDLLAVYPLGDPHFGMYSWAEETGDNFDLSIAEKLTCGAIDRLVDSAPNAETALILELGDMFHADNNTNMTARSGNVLDVDGRWAKVMQVGLRAMLYCIKRALSKHKTVVVRIVKGNHDDHSSFALALALDAYFSNNPRVTIDLNPSVFWYYAFGKVLLGVTHGDSCKTDRLPGIMAADKPEEWGKATYRHWYHGHIHHDSVKEHPGCMVESFRTLAARDAWHSSAGYRAGRDMKCIVHHKEYGEVERHRCDIGMIQ